MSNREEPSQNPAAKPLDPVGEPFPKPQPPAKELPPDAGFETICEHFGEDRMAHFGAAAPPIYQSSTFIYPDAAAFETRRRADCPYYDYTRVGNPTTAILEAKLAKLEKGNWAFGLASGMGAISAVINACVHAGAHVVIVSHCYGPTRYYLKTYLQRFGVTVTFVPGANPQDFIDAIRPETRLIYLESPTSGYMEIIDVEPIVAEARRRGIVTAFDNSWASPYFQNPLETGIDLVVHSATKYIGGHSDLVAGVVVGREDALYRRIGREAEFVGATLDPFAAWLMLRGLRTLALRLEQHQKNGLALARFLSEHPKVRRVHHPGLASHPGHAVARKQLRGFGGLFSIELREQSRAATHRFLDRLRLFHQGVSWGGHESLAIGGTFFGTDPLQPLWLIRLHAGLETTEDLVADVKQALEE